MTSEKTPADILVVDDTLANLQILVSMLEDHNYYVRPVNNGPAALRAARLARPDLILLDIQMPGMDGFTVCRELKEDDNTRDIPVIFISALDNIEDKVRAFQEGGVDYITKPFQLQEVLARVKTHLEIQRLRRLDQQHIAEQAALIADLDAYAHTVAHDLKNPLATIYGFATALESYADTLTEERRQEYLRKIVEGAEHMSAIIDALLLLASVRQQNDIPLAELNMSLVILNALARLPGQLAGVELVKPDSWPAARGYAVWVEEIWANYISNAIKYGGRPPRVELGADRLDNGMARFWVQDNGPGLTPEEQARLFTPFTRLSEKKHIKGHGLGLSIVRRIATKLGGEAGVTSAPGQGSRFYFTLPVV